MRTILLLFLSVSGFSQTPPIAVRLIDQANIPQGIRSRAEETAGHILDRAGIFVDWVPCLGPEGFRVHIVGRKPPNLRQDIAGFTVIPRNGALISRYAGVVYPAVLETARDLQADAALVLGAVMAHEIGHLLLGTRSHAPGGIMVPQFLREHLKLASQGNLLFDAREGAAMRASLSRYQRAAGPVAGCPMGCDVSPGGMAPPVSGF